MNEVISHPSLPRRRVFGLSRNLSSLTSLSRCGGKIACDEPKERLRGRLAIHISLLIFLSFDVYGRVPKVYVSSCVTVSLKAGYCIFR